MPPKISAFVFSCVCWRSREKVDTADLIITELRSDRCLRLSLKRRFYFLHTYFVTQEVSYGKETVSSGAIFMVLNRVQGKRFPVTLLPFLTDDILFLKV